MKILKLIIFFLFVSSFCFSQNDSRLANEYYNSKEFDKAEVLYDKLYKETGAKIYFNYYVNCLIEQTKYEEAEKVIGKQIKKNKSDLSFLVDLGYLYKKQNKLEDAAKEFDKAVEGIGSDASQVHGLASTFSTRSEFEYAAKVYLKARYITGNPYHDELANLFAVQRKYPEMIEEYLQMLSINSRDLEKVQSRMTYYIANDVNEEFYELLKTSLLKTIQKKSSLAYSELLIWLYMQKKDFTNALFQAKALDKRMNETGNRILEIAESAKLNEDYDIAKDAFDYVVSKGKMSPFYYKARFGLLDILYIKVTNGDISTPEQINELENKYSETIKELGITAQTIEIITDLAHLQAFYLNKAYDAVALLESALAIKGLPEKLLAACKIELGDILILQDDLWSASLMYGQAEKNNEGTTIADEAKFKKAKLAFFLNDFQWTKAQLDALKSSSSKLVSNDAIAFSLMIADNVGEEDSLYTELKIYSRAELLTFRNKKDEALLVLDTIIEQYPQHTIIDEALMLKAKIYEQKKMYEQAAQAYTKIVDEHSYDVLADFALFELANLYYEKLNDKVKAEELFKKLLLDYTDSIHTSAARKRYRLIRDGID